MSAAAPTATLEGLREQLAGLHVKVENLDEKVDDVKDLAGKTNGRLRRVELWKAEIQGAYRAVGIMPVLLTALASLSAIGSLIVVLVN